MRASIRLSFIVDSRSHIIVLTSRNDVNLSFDEEMANGIIMTLKKRTWKASAATKLSCPKMEL